MLSLPVRSVSPASLFMLDSISWLDTIIVLCILYVLYIYISLSSSISSAVVHRWTEANRLQNAVSVHFWTASGSYHHQFVCWSFTEYEIGFTNPLLSPNDNYRASLTEDTRDNDALERRHLSVAQSTAMPEISPSSEEIRLQYHNIQTCANYPLRMAAPKVKRRTVLLSPQQQVQEYVLPRKFSRRIWDILPFWTRKIQMRRSRPRAFTVVLLFTYGQIGSMLLTSIQKKPLKLWRTWLQIWTGMRDRLPIL